MLKTINAVLVCGALLSGCAALSEWAESAAASPAGQGVATGVAAAGDALADGFSALEAGGWAAGAAVAALGLLKAGVKGWRAANEAARRQKLNLIAEGVAKANGNGKKK